MANHLRTRLVLDALDLALWQRWPDGVIHHSDQGSQYTSITFGKRCRDAGVRPSTGWVGDCYDNAMCEGFFATLECELLERRRFRSHAEARMAVFEFIEGWYAPPDGATPPSNICHRSTTNGASYPPLAQIHDRPRNRGNSNPG